MCKNDGKYKEILAYIRNKRFFIFGAGAVAKRFYRYLIRNQLDGQVEAFVVSDKSNQPKSYHGKNVLGVDEISPNVSIVVAVHSSLFGDIENMFQNIGIKDYIWVYPYMFELDYSLPVLIDVTLDVNRIVNQLQGIYTHAIYYLVIKSFFEHNDIGNNLYLKLMRSFSELDTAYKRLEVYHQSIAMVKENGFKQMYNIKINHEYNLILDGAHRLMLAKYFNEKTIVADVYNCDFSRYLNVNGDIALTEKMMNKIFDDKELMIVKETYNSLGGRHDGGGTVAGKM